MGRPKKGESAKPPKAPARAKVGGPVTTGLNDDQLEALFWSHKRLYANALAAKKNADANFKNACKKAKSELGDHAVESLKLVCSIETDPEAEGRFKGLVEAQMRAARWAGAAVGTQFSLLDEVNRAPAVDMAFAEGRRHGLAGEPRKPGWAPGTDQYGAYMEGFTAGQDVLAQGIKKPTEPAAPPAAPLAKDDWKAVMKENGDSSDAAIKASAERLGTVKPTYLQS